MANKICARYCILIKGALASPLLVGSGESKDTDMDVQMRADGTLFVPGTSLAGVLKADFDRRKGRIEAEDREAFSLFGSSQFEKGETSYQSRIMVYDMELDKSGMSLLHRDGVKLDQYKTSAHMSKFDMQAVPAGTRYIMRFEIVYRENQLKKYDGDPEKAWRQDLEDFLPSICAMKDGFIRLGARTTRGFGKLEVEDILYRNFDLRSKEIYERWLDWAWDQDGAFEGAESLKNECMNNGMLEEHRCFSARFDIKGTLLIRQYDIEANKDRDYGQLTVPVFNDKDETVWKAVIPGSSWAGAVRSYLANMLTEFWDVKDWQTAQKSLEPFFGTWTETNRKEKDQKQEKLSKSTVIFDESVVEGGELLPITRNSVDRFTGGAATGALFCEEVCVGGKVQFNVRWTEKIGTAGGRRKDTEKDKGNSNTDSNILCGLLLWTVFGMENGFLAIGGETGVGRGILERKGEILLDGSKIDEKRCRRAAAEWCRGLNNGKR